MEFKDRIKELRKERDMTQGDLAELLGFKTYTTISKWESGDNLPRGKELKIMANFFNASSDYILGISDTREISKPRPVQLHNPARYDVTIKHANEHNAELIPIVGRIAAGTPTYAEEDIIGYMSLPSDKKKKDDLIYLEVTSDSMDMKFPVGSYVLIDTQTQIENGDVAAVKINGEEVTLKKVKYTDDGLSVMLIPQSHNEDYYPIKVNIEETQLKLIGKAVGMYLSM